MPTGLYISMSFKPKIGGAEEHAHQIVKALIEQGERIVVLAAQLGTADERDFDESCGYPIIRLQLPKTSTRNPVRLLFGKPQLFSRVLTHIWRLRPDYIISNSVTSLIPLVAIELACLGRRIPHVQFLHHVKPNSRERPQSIARRFRQRVALMFGDMVFCVSDYSRARRYLCRCTSRQGFCGIQRDQLRGDRYVASPFARCEPRTLCQRPNDSHRVSAGEVQGVCSA